MKTKRVVGVLTASAALLLSASGCGDTQAETAVTDNIVSYQQIEQEFFDTVEKLSWPAAFPAPTKFSEDPDLSYQKGWGDTLASYKFECAWSQEWLATYGQDEAAAAAALAQLEKIPDMGFMSPKRTDDATRNLFQENLTKAKLGDPSGIQENVTANCAQD